MQAEGWEFCGCACNSLTTAMFHRPLLGMMDPHHMAPVNSRDGGQNSRPRISFVPLDHGDHHHHPLQETSATVSLGIPDMRAPDPLRAPALLAPPPSPTSSSTPSTVSTFLTEEETIYLPQGQHHSHHHHLPRGRPTQGAIYLELLPEHQPTTGPVMNPSSVMSPSPKKSPRPPPELRSPPRRQLLLQSPSRSPPALTTPPPLPPRSHSRRLGHRQGEEDLEDLLTPPARTAFLALRRGQRRIERLLYLMISLLILLIILAMLSILIKP